MADIDPDFAGVVHQAAQVGGRTRCGGLTQSQRREGTIRQTQLP
jgi:hypothetical protein